jgi:hypothetical protein
MALPQYNVLTLQCLTPVQLPPSDQVGANLDCVLQPYLTVQAVEDAVRSVGSFSQPSLLVVAADGQLGALAPIGTVTYSGSTGAQTVVLDAISTAFTAGATDAATAAAGAAAFNALNTNFLQGMAYVNPAAPTVLIIQGRWPGIAQNSNAFSATGTGATASAATLGGSVVAPARAGVTISQVNQLGIGTPLFP